MLDMALPSQKLCKMRWEGHYLIELVVEPHRGVEAERPQMQLARTEFLYYHSEPTTRYRCAPRIGDAESFIKIKAINLAQELSLASFPQ